MTPPTVSLELSSADARRVRWRRFAVDSPALEPLAHPLWVACAWDQQPLGGLIARCDQRLDCALSRQQMAGRLSLILGEVTLVGAAHRLAGAHLLVLGLGTPEAFDSSVADAIGSEAADRVHKLGHAHYALEVPWAPDRAGPEAIAVAAAFVSAHVRRRLELLGRGGALSVTWLLPQNVPLVSGGHPGRPGRKRRKNLWTRRHQRVRRVVFFRHRRKK